MNSKIIKIIKLSLIGIGALLLLVSSKLTMATMDFHGDQLGNLPFHKEFEGTSIAPWYLAAFGGLLPFLLSFFSNTLFFKVSYYLILLVTLLLSTVFTMAFSIDTEYYSNNMKSGFYVAACGFILVATGTLISLHREVRKVNRNHKLLDSDF